jgi:hypothetical protein
MVRIAKPIVVFVVMVAILSLPATTMASENVITTKESLEGQGTVFPACSPDGEGEWVNYEGTVRIVVREDVSTPGGIHQNFHTNWMGVRGIGATTGNLYVMTGVFNLHTNGSQGAYGYTYATGMTIISPASGDNYIVHNTIHLTWGSDGEVHAEIEFLRAECRG